VEPAGGLWDALGLAERWEWAREGLCAQTDPEVFFPEKGQSNTTAKRICAACPVRAACLAAALERRELFGVWGGLSELERRRLLRAGQVAA
jgi:WhiB family transcriptional regulator, redox-sensing transcriptional regulator